jgi:hypothetical protein
MHLIAYATKLNGGFSTNDRFLITNGRFLYMNDRQGAGLPRRRLIPIFIVS